MRQVPVSTRDCLRVPARHQDVEVLVGWLDKYLAPRCPSARYFELRAALLEVTSNIIRHGLRGGDDNEEIIVVLTDNGNCLVIEVEDRGEPIPAGMLERAQIPDFDVDHIESLPESGFGLGIITAAVDRFEYQTFGSANRLTLTVDLGART